MDSQRWQQIKTLFEQALEIEPTERQQWLQQHCADDPDLQQEVEKLLQADTPDSDEELSGPLTELVAKTANEWVQHNTAFTIGDSIGPYRIVETLGEGGMGTVYLAERTDQTFERRVAIKLVRSLHLNQETLSRFHAERQILANLNHPNIAALLDGGTTEQGLPFLAMEYVEGLPILEYCKHNNITLRHRIQLMQQVCAAIEYAHQNLVVHRDIKPANILVSASGQVKVLDFGIAKMLDESNPQLAASQTSSEIRLLTPESAAPEQFTGGIITTRTDIFALGNLLYQLLTERLPYDLPKENRLLLERLVCEKDPAKPSQVVEPNFSLIQAGKSQRSGRPARLEEIKGFLQGDMDTIILKAMQKDPQRRYQSVQQFSEDLNRFLNNFPIQARPDSLAYRIGKFVRRHRIGTTLAALASLFAIGFVTVIVMQSIELRKQTRIALEEARQSEAISEFLIDTFDAADPNNSAGEVVSAKQILARGETTIAELDDQPELKASMLLAIGRVYQKLSDFEKALQLIQQAETMITEQSLQLRPSQQLQLFFVKADLAFELGDYPVAEQSYRNAIDLLQPDPNADEQTLIDMQLGLVSVLSEVQKDDEALPIQQAVVDRQLRRHGPDSAEYAEALTFLGHVLRRVLKYDEAEQALRQALTAKRAAYGNQHLETAHTLNQLARTLTFTHKYDEALQLAEEGLSIRQQIHQTDNPEIAASFGNIAHILAAAQRYDEAVTARKNSLQVLINAFGEQHIYVAGTYASLASLLRQQGDLEEAEQTFKKAIQLFQQLYPDEPSIKLALPLSGLAQTYLDGQQADAALEPAQQALQIRQKLLDKDNWRIAASLELLGDVHQALAQSDQSKSFYAQALTLYQKSLPDDDEKIIGLQQKLQALP